MVATTPDCGNRVSIADLQEQTQNADGRGGIINQPCGIRVVTRYAAGQDPGRTSRMRTISRPERNRTVSVPSWVIAVKTRHQIPIQPLRDQQQCLNRRWPEIGIRPGARSLK